MSNGNKTEAVLWENGSGGLRLSESGESFHLYNAAGEKLTTITLFQRTGSGRDGKEYLFPGPAEKSAEGIRFPLGNESGTGKAVLVVRNGNGSSVISFSVEGSGNASWIGLEASVHEKDHFLGFGERFDLLDQRGEYVDLHVENGACGKKTYKPIPFFMTPRGYGVHIDTCNRVLSRMGTVERPDVFDLELQNRTGTFDWYIGRNMAEILEAYTGTVGRTELPGPWAFGPWKSRDWKTENQDTVYEDLRIQRELGIDCTVKLIDASWQNGYNSFSFHPDRFPEPEEMIREAREKGYRVILWISPWMHEGTEAFRKAEERGYLATDGHGNVKMTRLGNDPDFRGVVFDFTNLEAVEWWKGELRRLMEMGVSGFKTDFGEQVDEDAVFSDGRTGKELHNLFPYLYNQAAWEVVSAYGGVLLGRSAWHGSQKFHGIWAGDQSADFARRSGLPSVVTAGISAGYSGFFFWGSDIGGYYSAPEKATFIRWSQFGTFSPIMQVHGMGEHDPWKFDDETLRIYKAFAGLRMKLLPYILSAGREYMEKGLPLMRGLGFDYADDEKIFTELPPQYEYLFGSSVLVAPICFGGTGRLVYLPEGSWLDWWTGEVLNGGRSLRIESGMARIPLFLKAGAIVPTGDGSADSDAVLLELFPVAGCEENCTLPGGKKITMKTLGNGRMELHVEKWDTERPFEIRVLGCKDVRLESASSCRVTAEGSALSRAAELELELEQAGSRCTGASFVLEAGKQDFSLLFAIKGDIN